MARRATGTASTVTGSGAFWPAPGLPSLDAASTWASGLPPQAAKARLRPISRKADLTFWEEDCMGCLPVVRWWEITGHASDVPAAVYLPKVTDTCLTPVNSGYNCPT